MGRGDLSDAQWMLLEPLLPKQRRGGKPFVWTADANTILGRIA